MSLPGNGIFVVQGEMAMLVTAMRRSTRWGSHSFPNEEYDVLMRTFQDLKTILNQVDDLRLLDPSTYLSPFLEVIRSKETTGPVTSLALSAIHKFLSYGLIDPTHPSVPATVDDIADAVTHARFVGTDHSSDGVVLLKILQVLRTLMLSPEGAMLTDESVCEIMLSCFRTCFETRLTELLRRNAEQCLRDMTQLIFMRLPQFPPEDSTTAFTTLGLSLKRRDKSAKKKITAANSTNSLERKSSLSEQTGATSDNEAQSETKTTSILQTHNQDKNLLNEAEITIEPVDQVKSPKKHLRHSSMDLANENNTMTQLLEKCVSNNDEPDVEPIEAEEKVEEAVSVAEEIPLQPEIPPQPENPPKEELPTEITEKMEEYVNDRGVRFTPQDEVLNLQPYGLQCVRELFRFLISLCNPLDTQNTSAMVYLGLSLVGTALEVGADQITKYPSLLYLVKDPLCKNLLSLLDTERISIFALDLQIWFLLFEALRVHLKYQMEAFFKKIVEIISADTTKSIYELKEIHHIALENLAQMFRIPGLCTELYLNFDCDVYCMNVFEELAKLLSKNVVSSTAYNIHILSLEALMTIIEAIEMGTMQKVESESESGEIEIEREKETGRGGHISLELGGLDDASVVSDLVTHDISQYFGGGRTGRHKPSTDLPTEAELDNVRNMKKWVVQGTELFNQKPERGIEFLQEHGVLPTPQDPHQVARFLRENPDLDKKMIGEYLCKRSSRDEEQEGGSVLSAFADSFDFAGLRLEQALRIYLETFRLPGEAPLISLVMEKFAERWHSTNGEPFANTDAAFRLAYAVIMLNVDQHNHNAKKMNVPMTVEDFVKNLRGCNGNGDFEQAMLEAVFYSIKNEEMVMPAERVGPLRDAYLWRVLQRRGRGAGARYRVAPARHPLHARLLPAAVPPQVTALSAAFERASPPTPEEIESNNTRDCAALIALNGLERVAALVARLSADTITLDTLILTLCKFTGLLTPQHTSYIAIADTITLDTLILTLCKFTGFLTPQHTSYIPIGVSLGQSSKAQAALRRACSVAARHAHCARASWRHLLEALHTLYVARLLPQCLVEAEDYLAPGGTVSLIREATRGSDSGLLSSIYSYIALGESSMRAPTPHEKALIDAANDCVAKCNFPGLLITETKFLPLESLQELIRAMVAIGTPPDSDSLQLNPQLEDITIFFLELLGQTLIQNRDRVSSVWSEAGGHMDRVLLWSGSRGSSVLRRALTAQLRTSARLMRCEQCAPLVLARLRVLYRLPYKLFYQQADVISCGLYELVKTSAQNVHSGAEWAALLSLLAAAGAGAWPRRTLPQTTGSSRSEGSEDEGERRPTSASSESELSHSPQTQGWIMVKNESTASIETVELEVEQVSLRPHRSSALARCVEALALVIRDVAHVTPHNCRAAVRCVRLLARATLQSGKTSNEGSTKGTRSPTSDDERDSPDHYHMVSIQLLDLMHTLHSRTAQIFKWWKDEADQGQGSEDYDLWEVAWKPLLQGIAEFCTDRRKQVANSAIAYLQRALLAPALSALGGEGWEACFEHVLLPLISNPPRRPDAAARADTVMCKVFLQHLGALGGRASFAALWARVVRAQRALLAAPAEPLREAALESLKNMLLVMHSVRIFSNADGYNDLWYITWDIIGEFLPNLKQELFPDANDNMKAQQNLPSHMQPSLPLIPTIVPVAANSTPTHPTSQPLPAHPHTNTGPNAGPTPPTITNPQLVQASQNQSIPIQIQRSSVQSPNILVASVAHSPVNLGQSPPQISNTPLVTPMPVSGTNVGQNPGTFNPVVGSKSPGSGAVSPTFPAQPVSGMVPIRNPLYDQAGLTSSVLLQPLNEMISTPIGISIQSQQPILYPRPAEPQSPQKLTNENSSYAPVIEPTLPDKDIKEIHQSEIYAEYITNPYNEVKELSAKEATLYDPEDNRIAITNEQNTQESDSTRLILGPKSLSANVTPMHSKNKAQFGSTDNIRQESSIFNFTSYFGAVNEKVSPGSEVFDALMSTQEG